MNLIDRENKLIERYAMIEDRHERLNAIVSHKFPLQEITIEERCPEYLVQGCASQVWLIVVVNHGKLNARYGSDSVLVKGLVALLVELYHSADVVEVRQFLPRILNALDLDKMLSATRLNGLAQVMNTFHNAADVD